MQIRPKLREKKVFSSNCGLLAVVVSHGLKVCLFILYYRWQKLVFPHAFIRKQQ